ncbi:MAG: TonB family protein [Gemmatimonadaceae bacterium]|nr:TonB family protein [Gemmatimonadaceae bacterium]
MHLTRLLVVTSGFIVAACRGGSGDAEFRPGRRPDVLPVMLNKELPFRYPPALYAQKIQGNVTLRIFVDSAGMVVTDSTHVAETSGFAALDSAAVKGSRELKFNPAKTRDSRVPVSILFPVYFRHPEAAPLPGDSAIGKTPTRAP